MFDLLPLINLANNVGIIQQVSYKLMRQNEPAAEKLAEVLDELAKMVNAIDGELVEYLTLYFRSQQEITQGRAVLLGLEVGQSKIRMNEARGHCHKITNIYEKYLKRWFHSVLDEAECNQLEWLFQNLSTADSVLLDAINAVAEWLTSEAQLVLDYVDDGRLDDANSRIRQARLALRDARTQLMEAVCQLRGLQADFISVSRTV